MRKKMSLLLAALALVAWPGGAGNGSGGPVGVAEAAPVGSGTLFVLVTDERDRPLQGAVVWALGTKLAGPPPSEPVVIDQEGLEFRPRFLVARRGQKLIVTNKDPELHNVHSSDACCSWNEIVSVGGSCSRVLDQAGEATFLCNIHSNMRCVLLVLDSIYALTDASGQARLELPLGRRKLRVLAQDKDRAELELEIAPVTSAKVVLHEPTRVQILPPEALPWPAVAVRLGESLDAAVRFARAGRADDARAAAEEADGKWLGASGLYAAIKEADAGASEHKGRADDLRSEVRRMPRRAENAAAQGGEAVDQLARQVEKLENIVLDIARTLPKR